MQRRIGLTAGLVLGLGVAASAHPLNLRRTVLLAKPEGASWQVMAPAVSPAGRWMTFGAEGRTWLGDLRARQHRALFPQSVDGQPWDVRWSPHGRRIAFVVFRDSTEELWTVRPDGSDAGCRYRAAPPEGCFEHYACSPRGHRLAFVNQAGLWCMEPDGAHRRLVLPNPRLDRFAWSRDSRALTAWTTSSLDRPQGHQSYLVDERSGRVTRLRSPLRGAGVGEAAVGRDRALALVTYGPGLRRAYGWAVAEVSVWLRRPGAHWQRLTRGEGHAELRWSPGGRLLAVSRGRGEYVKQGDTFEVWTRDGRRIGPPQHGCAWQWSPNGRRLIFGFDTDGAGSATLACLADGSRRTWLAEGDDGQATASAWTADSRAVIYSHANALLRFELR